MNTAWLYHPDGSECVDSWSCQAQDHTSIPPRCGAGADGRPIGCELPKGHPGPHLHFADLECCGAGEEHPAALASSKPVAGRAKIRSPADRLRRVARRRPHGEWDARTL